MDYRLLGQTGLRVSTVGFGGLVVDQVEPDDAARLVGQAVERGITYFDAAPSYGQCEERLGPALAPYRERVVLSCSRFTGAPQCPFAPPSSATAATAAPCTPARWPAIPPSP